MLYTIIGVLVLIIVLMIIFFIYKLSGIKAKEKEYLFQKSKWEDLYEKEKSAKLEIDKKQAELDRLNADISAAIKSFEDSSNNHTITLAKLGEGVSNKVAELEQLNGALEEKNASMKEMERRNIEVDALLKAKQDELGIVTGELDTVTHKLASVQALHRKAVLEDWNSEKDAPGVRCTFGSLTPNENRLIELIGEISISYPELSVEFGKIVWSKVWMPKVQSWVKMYDLGSKVNCIYKLTLLSNPSVCYIGQAVDLKERWYTHIKKMVGAEAKGWEKLYNVVDGVRPDMFRWEVIEEGLERGELDSRERFWIEYFGCVEVGLNKR